MIVFLMFQISTSCASNLCGLPGTYVSDPDLWDFQQGHAEACAISKSLCTAAHWCNGRFLYHLSGMLWICIAIDWLIDWCLYSCVYLPSCNSLLIDLISFSSVKIHSGYATALHLQSSRDDPLGARYPWGPETIGESFNWRPGQDLGTRGIALIPGQVRSAYFICFVEALCHVSVLLCCVSPNAAWLYELRRRETGFVFHSRWST